jgi:hypothetical protein
MEPHRERRRPQAPDPARALTGHLSRGVDACAERWYTGRMGRNLSPLARRLAGVALLAPLAAVCLWGLSASTGCDIDCGEVGRGVFVYMLLTTPFAAAGALALAWDLPRAHRAGRLFGWLLFAGVALCTLLLAGAALAAGLDGIGKLTSAPNFEYVDAPGAAEAQQHDDGIAMLIVSGVLGAMAVVAAAAVRAAHRKLTP